MFFLDEFKYIQNTQSKVYKFVLVIFNNNNKHNNSNLCIRFNSWFLVQAKLKKRFVYTKRKKNKMYIAKFQYFTNEAKS